jgi:hypothetical protein
MVMKDIEIKNIKETTCCLCCGDGEAIGVIKSYLSLLDVSSQIKEKHLKGYYLLWVNYEKGESVIHIKIDEFGELESYPEGFYDESIKLLLKLV